jgi:outer membrane protein TolC
MQQQLWEASDLMISREGALEDPVLGVTALNLPSDSFVFDSTPMSGLQLSLRQRIPFPGKLGLKEKLVAEQAHAQNEAYNEHKGTLVALVHVLYYRLALIDEELAITERNKHVLEELAEVVEAKYGVGKGLQQDVLTARLELSGIDEKLVSLMATRASTAAELNTLLNRSTEEPIRVAPALTKMDVGLSLEQLQTMALDSRSLLKDISHRVAGATHRRDLARMGYLPDFTVGLDYRFRHNVAGDPVEGRDFVSASVSMNIPLFFYRKQSKDVGAEQAQLGALRWHLEQARDAVLHEVSDLFHQMKAVEKLILLYDARIIEQASLSLDATRSGYEVDTVDFLTVLDSQKALYDYQIKQARLIYKQKTLMAKLEAAVGVPLHSGR